MVADYHALTTPFNPTEIQKNIREMVLDWLAVGISPSKSTIFLQSKVPEHTELALLLGMVTPLSWLLRCPTYKEQIRNYPAYQNFGLLGYPVLQAADILIYQAEAVPVGEDQLPHLELAREIARTFNHKFGKTFTEPQAILSKAPKIMGLDRPSEKMSKSFGDSNCLYLSDTDDAIREKIKKAVTDVGPKGKKMSPGVKNLFRLMELFSPKETLKNFQKLYLSRRIKYEKMKIVLAEDIIKRLRPFRERRLKLVKNAEYINQILKEGSKKAEGIAQKTLDEAKKKMGLV